MSHPPCLLIVSPHADDEVLGAPSLVSAARDARWRVVNMLCFVSPADRQRRLTEVGRATESLRIELRVASEPLLSVSARSEPAVARDLVASEVGRLLVELGPAAVLSPSPHDGHYAHEAVGHGVRSALEAQGPGARWIMWGWWGELPLATTVSWFDRGVMDRAQQALAFHKGELDRLDLSSAVDARARWYAAVGPERVMGPGYRSGVGDEPEYADLLLEARSDGQRWLLGRPRVSDADQVLDEPAWGELDVTPWLDAVSASRLVGRSTLSNATVSG